MNGFGPWPLYGELHAICREMEVGSGVASHLACRLDSMGCERVADVYGLPLEEIAEGYRIGSRALSVARALGAERRNG